MHSSNPEVGGWVWLSIWALHSGLCCFFLFSSLYFSFFLNGFSVVAFQYLSLMLARFLNKILVKENDNNFYD